MSYKFLLWGTAKRAEMIMADKSFQQAGELVGFVDTYRGNAEYMRRKVYSPADAAKMMEGVDYLILANSYFAENIALCIQLGIDLRKVVITDNVQIPGFQEMFLRLRDISQEAYAAALDTQLRLAYANESDRQDTARFLGTGRFSGYRSYMLDYFRFRTFEFASREIVKNGVPGAVAELGVFRGTFASLINQSFPDRKLYLFDTFEGFAEAEAKKEIELGRCDEGFIASHQETSVQQVLNNMPHPEQCVVCKGLFPGCVTQDACAETYSFVSLDVDFEESTYQGLSFFYPRLSEGGMIFLHDYTTYYLEGVRQAVQRFQTDWNLRLKKVPLADRAGTLVIVK